MGRMVLGPPLRIAVVVPFVDRGRSYGGPLTVAQQHVAWLVGRGHDVVVLAPTAKGDEGFCASLFAAPVVTHRAWRSRRVGMSSVVSPGLVRAAGRLEVDVTHVHLARDLVLPFVARRAARRSALVLQTHGMVVGGSRLRGLLEGLLTTPVLRRASMLCWLTPEEEAALAAVAPSAPRRFLPNGIDPAEAAAVAATPGDPGRLRLGFVSRLTPRKRPVLAVELCGRVHEAGVDVELVLAGPDDGELAPALARAEELGIAARVSYLGALERGAAMSVTKGCDVLVLPARHEPFPMVVLEAMGLGVATLITEECGIAPHLTGAAHDGVVPVDPAGLLDAATALVVDEARRARTAAEQQAQVLGQFSAERVADGLEALYADVARR